MLAFKNYKLGEADQTFQIESKEENYQASVMMTEQSKRCIDIISRDMDPAVYDQKEFIEALRRLALRGQRVKIRILIFDVNGMIRRGHRIIELASQLSSFIELRKPANEFKDYNEGLLIADNIGYIQRKNYDRYEGKLNFYDKRQAKFFLQGFEDMWATAKPDPNLRRVTI